MDLATRLAEERRRRLAAERLLELKQAELFAANRKLGKHALALSHEVTERRAEVAQVRDQNQRMTLELGEATERIELVEGQMWAALEAMRDGFAMFDAEGQLELANSAFMSLFDGLDSVRPGASRNHLLEMMIEEGIVDLQGEDPDDWIGRMRARWGGDPIPSETLRLWNGGFVKLQDRRRPDGGIVSLAVEITELMRMWSAVEELPDGFVLYDAEDRLLMCNQPYLDFYADSAPAIRPGTSFEEILRYGLANRQYAEAIGREEDWLRERLENHRRADHELEQQLADGRWLRIYERETRDGGRVGLRIDITQIKRDQERLREAMIRAEAANKAKSSFLANMSHEIRTPMNGVIGMADLLMERGLDEEQRLYVDTIRSSGEALLVIINDILDYSKIEADKLVLHPEPFDLEQAIHGVVLLLQPAAREKGLSMLIDYDMFLPTRFIGDPGRLRQVLTNLVGNAVKFTLSGHILVRVTGVGGDPGSTDASTALHITVEDTGIGIAPDKLDAIFEEFSQVESERNRSFDGTGLGLAITRRLVSLMEGEVWAESTPGQGSCFGIRIVLPADESADPAFPTLPAGFRRILVADPDPGSRAILQRQLDVLGLEPAFCSDGAALCEAIDPPPDLLLIDNALSDGPGTALVAELRRRGLRAPAILMSETAGAQAEIGPTGVQGLLQKPIARRTLFAALQEAAGTPPLARAEATPESPAPAPTRDPARGRPEILLAEDNRTNQLVFRKMVAGLDLDLRFAANGHEAVEAFRTRRPDAIFMDISMPGMDGKQATLEIRRLEEASGADRVPVIAVTAHAMSGDREAILAAGLDDYLTKPIRKAQLLEKLSAHLPALRERAAG